MHKVVAEIAEPACPSEHNRAAVANIEVTSQMIWAALEEWSGFDEVRDELEPLFARIYRAMDGARRRSSARR